MWPVRVFSPGRSPRGSPKSVAACVGQGASGLRPEASAASPRPRQPADSVVGSGWWPGLPCPGAAAHQLTLFAFKLVVKLSCGTIRPEKPKECAGPGFCLERGFLCTALACGIGANTATACSPLAARFVPANYLQDSPGQLSPQECFRFFWPAWR